ncbi:polysaccharide pyruvyl transferase family protein [Clostridium sp. P21]|uniref:Polysaccharide pyruvyl transferase family protein n=1 Tax=Clostridium muellerianum TaxID=2716538 RepID=A0A7Y0EKZ7_9CLOT|nr:polysaccharide pyruvyl transferase family protein [Clostridium muellerianum]NMM65331.1 polysaccharide pyruvyl transferase family protein [Clostridium muellerianum]
MKRIFYLGWLGFNNLGDELMWEIFNALCKEYLSMEDYEIVPSNPSINITDISPYDCIVLGGGSLILPGYIKILHKAVKEKKQIIIWGSGYDWADKFFIKVIEEAKAPSYLFDDETETQLFDIINKSTYVGVRGPLTYALLKSINLDTNKIQISGDPGLLLKPKELPNLSPILKWKNEDKVIGLNWGTSYNKIYGKNESDVEDQLASTCKILLNQGYKIYMYLLWGKDLEPSISLYNKINSSSNVILDKNIYEAGELLSILGKCAFSINFKLHANVLCTAAQIPFVCLAYRFKCFDFMKSLDLDKLLVPTDSTSIQQDILNIISYINSNQLTIREKISKYKKMYTERLLTPFLDHILL